MKKMKRCVVVGGARYPQVGAEISYEYQYSVSNEMLPGEIATVSVTNGKLLLIKVQKK